MIQGNFLSQRVEKIAKNHIPVTVSGGAHQVTPPGREIPGQVVVQCGGLGLNREDPVGIFQEGDGGDIPDDPAPGHILGGELGEICVALVGLALEIAWRLRAMRAMEASGFRKASRQFWAR